MQKYLVEVRWIRVELLEGLRTLREMHRENDWWHGLARKGW